MLSKYPVVRDKVFTFGQLEGSTDSNNRIAIQLFVDIPIIGLVNFISTHFSVCFFLIFNLFFYILYF